MIGNDIVDLNASRRESNWQRKGWLQKIFSGQEQDAIHLSADRERMVWLFWSMKEAAYKIYNRASGEVRYAPHSFNCIITETTSGTATGKVFHEGCTYNTKTIFNTRYIHTITRTNDDMLNTQILLADNITIQPLQLSPYLILLRDKLGLPYMQDLQSGKQLPASLSHHGRYYALVY